eukprot:SAG31_NODE_6785_length_1889_cov_2.230168_2_plen_205_part_00
MQIGRRRGRIDKYPYRYQHCAIEVWQRDVELFVLKQCAWISVPISMITSSCRCQCTAMRRVITRFRPMPKNSIEHCQHWPGVVKAWRSVAALLSKTLQCSAQGKMISWKDAHHYASAATAEFKPPVCAQAHVVEFPSVRPAVSSHVRNARPHAFDALAAVHDVAASGRVCGSRLECSSDVGQTTRRHFLDQCVASRDKSPVFLG